MSTRNVDMGRLYKLCPEERDGWHGPARRRPERLEASAHIPWMKKQDVSQEDLLSTFNYV